MTCWRGECQRGCYYPDSCSEGELRARAEAAEARIAEFQWNALEMARKADIAEARAEGTEAELERLKSAADKVGHQAACKVDPCDCWMRDLAPLLDDSSDPECPGLCGEHHWLDRPESDTRECLICGAEVAG